LHRPPQERGFERKHTEHGSVWVGLDLKDVRLSDGTPGADDRASLELMDNDRLPF
jgi:hypothetical protein